MFNISKHNITSGNELLTIMLGYYNSSNVKCHNPIIHLLNTNY